MGIYFTLGVFSIYVWPCMHSEYTHLCQVQTKFGMVVCVERWALSSCGQDALVPRECIWVCVTQRAGQCIARVWTGECKVQFEGALEGLSFTPSSSSQQNFSSFTSFSCFSFSHICNCFRTFSSLSLSCSFSSYFFSSTYTSCSFFTWSSQELLLFQSNTKQRNSLIITFLLRIIFSTGMLLNRSQASKRLFSHGA